MAFETRGWTPARIISRATAQNGELSERRRSARVKMELPGRYLTPEGEEYGCVTVDFSPSGMRFRAPTLPRPGANIVAYVRELGRVQGRVVRRLRDGFIIAVAATGLKAERLTQKIARLRAMGAEDRRLFPRLVLEGAMIPVRCADGRNQMAPILDVSETGIALRTDIALKLGERVEIGEQTGVVVRLFEGGAAARFI